MATPDELYAELLRLLYDDPMWIWAADEKNIQIFQCSVEDFVYNPLWAMPRWAFYDKYVRPAVSPGPDRRAETELAGCRSATT